MRHTPASAALYLCLAAGTALALPPDQVFTRAAAFTWQVRALGANERLLGTAWYAPEVKRFVRLEHKVWAWIFSSGRGQPIGRDIVELLSYRPPR